VRYETYEEISERLLRYADDLDQTELTARPLPV